MPTKRIDAAALEALASATNELMAARAEQLDEARRAQFVDNADRLAKMADDLMDDLAHLLGRIGDVVALDQDLLDDITREV